MHAVSEFQNGPVLGHADVPRTRVSVHVVGVVESAIAAWSAACVAAVGRAWVRQRQRGELLDLGDRELRDIGLSRYEALVEGCKPFWK